MPTKSDVKEFKGYLFHEAKRRNVKLEFRKNLNTFGMINPNDKRNNKIILRDFSSNKHLDIYKYTFFHELGHLRQTKIQSVINHIYVNKFGSFCLKDKGVLTFISKREMSALQIIFNCVEDAMIDSRLIRDPSMQKLYENFVVKFNTKGKRAVFHERDYLNHISFMIKLFMTGPRYLNLFTDTFGMKKSYMNKIKIDEFLNLVKGFDSPSSSSLKNFKLSVKIFGLMQTFGFRDKFKNKADLSEIKDMHKMKISKIV